MKTTVPKGVPEMLGEFLREAAVLVVVFGFLDQLLAEREMTLGYGIAVLASSGFILMSGIVLELTRRR
ncbi:MAG: hypothetical protein HY700_06330 [Gemmatimonadetes bacterium]|nr:hypothetical protein [Gemmatimonadota bacterium]